MEKVYLVKDSAHLFARAIPRALLTEPLTFEHGRLAVMDRKA
jgi:hypothetical protein